MKKKLLIIFSFITSLSFSQQVLKRITETSTATIVETFVAANGNNPNNIVGSWGFSGASTSEGDTVFRTPTSTSTIGDATSTYLTPPTIPNETIGNGTFQTTSNSKKTVSGYQNSSGTQTLNIITEEENSFRDAIEDTNTNNDLLYYKIALPKTLIGGTPIEIGTYAAVNTHLGVDINTGGSVGNLFLYFQWNGTSWGSVPTNWNGQAGANLQSIDSNGQLLNVNELSINSEIKLYPIPTNNFITIQKKEISTENFLFKILDLTGRIVKNGNSNYGEQISLEELNSGNYIIQIETENDEKLTKTLIKN